MAVLLHDYLWKGLASIASLVGLDSYINDVVSDTRGEEAKVTSAKLADIINEIVNTARNNGKSKLNEVESRLTSLIGSIPRDNKQRDLLVKARDDINKRLSKLQNSADLAEDKLVQARNLANQADYMSKIDQSGYAGEKLKETVQKLAEDSANKFNSLGEDKI